MQNPCCVHARFPTAFYTMEGSLHFDITTYEARTYPPSWRIRHGGYMRLISKNVNRHLAKSYPEESSSIPVTYRTLFL